jgi:serine/threonine protein kinase
VELTLQSMKTLADLLDRALALEGEARTQWLDQLDTGPHAALSPLVKEMLAKRSELSTRFLSDPLRFAGPNEADAVAHEVAGALPRLEPGARIGAYALVRELGRGGMGVVWLAERSDGQLKRQVALKLPMLAASDALAERFVRERNILAQLEHANIARLYDAGITEAGQPFLALEYVSGEPITAHCDRKRLEIRDRLTRFLDVARAVQYAHANLVVHRDLKPNNILVTDEGAVRLLDFGIAKLLDDSQSEAHETELTRMVGRALTLDYASPEQVQGRAIGIASDVYSLGVILYQLLCGLKPYSIGHDQKFNAEKILTETEPMPPSLRAVRNEVDCVSPVGEGSTSGSSARAALRRTSPERLARQLAGDLDTIVAKAMRKASAERYNTVAEFAADIERYLQGLPVLAQPESWRYRTQKFVRRNKIVVGATAAVAASTIVGLGVALWQTSVAREQANRADQETAIARAEKMRADEETLGAKRERERADAQALAAQQAALEATAQAKRADDQALAARREAARADAAAALAMRSAARAEAETKIAQRESARSSAVQGFMTDLFSANSNDQRNAIQVRNLNAKELLDRGVSKLNSKGVSDPAVSASLLHLFGNLYENLNDYETSKKLHERSAAAAAAVHGKRSREYANAILDWAWVEGYSQVGKRLDLIEEAVSILRSVEPNSVALARALTIESENLDRVQPKRALQRSSEAIQILERYPKEIKLRALAHVARAQGERAIGDYEAALSTLERAAVLFEEFSGADGPQAGDAWGGVGMTQRELLQLRAAKATLQKTTDVLRHFNKDPVAATVFGRGLATTRAELGDVAEAQRDQERAYSLLKDSNDRPHPLKALLSAQLAQFAQMRGDAQEALRLSLRAESEQRSRTTSTQVLVVAISARAAVDAGSVEVAQAAIERAHRLRGTATMPDNVARSLLRAEYALARARGDASRAAELLGAIKALRGADTSPRARLQVALDEMRSEADSDAWDRVAAIARQWVGGDIKKELPTIAEADLWLALGEAQLRLCQNGAALSIENAAALLADSQVPDSARLKRLRALRGELGLSTAVIR